MPNVAEEKLYNVNEVAELFEKTSAWVYWCITNDKFLYENGDLITPTSQTPKGSKKSYNLETIQEMALSLYRSKTMTEEELRAIIRKVLVEKEKHRMAISEGE